MGRFFLSGERRGWREAAWFALRFTMVVIVTLGGLAGAAGVVLSLRVLLAGDAAGVVFAVFSLVIVLVCGWGLAELFGDP